MQVTRVVNCVAAAAATLLGAYLAVGTSTLESGRAWRATAAVGLIVAGANIVNDVHDVEADRIGKPHRPIPSGRVSSRVAADLAAGCGLVALALAATLGWTRGLVAAALIALSLAYSYRLKSTVLAGNVCVGFLVASTVVYGAWATGSATGDAWLAAAVMFPFLVAYEVMKCVQDHRPDAKARVRTIATVWGARPAAVVSVVLVGAVLVFVAVLGVAGAVPARYAVATEVACLVPALVASVPVVRQASEERVHVSVGVMKAGWFTGMAAMVLLR